MRPPRSSTSPIDSSFPLHLIPSHQSSPQTLKLHPPPWDAHSCLGFDTWLSSKRGNFVFPSINEFPLSLISHQFYYYFYSTQFSLHSPHLSHLSLIHFLALTFGEGLVASTCNNFLFVNRNIWRTKCV